MGAITYPSHHSCHQKENKKVLVISSVKTTSNCNSQGVFFLCVCMCAHTQAHVCSGAHTLLCLCGGQRIALGNSLYTISLVCFLRHSLSRAWNSSSRLRCPCLLLSNIGIINICHHVWLFYVGSRNTAILCGKYALDWAISPTPKGFY